MDYQDLRAFISIVEHGGFRAAAEATSTAQPWLTRQMQRLERSLGVRLLERGPSGVRLTERGESFLAGARRALAALDEARSAATGAQRETIRVGAAATAAGSFLARFLATWIPNHPETHLVMIEDGARNLRQRLERNECDLAIVAAPIPAAFGHHLVRRVTVQALLPHAHELAGSTAPLDVAALHRQRVLLNGERFLSTEIFRSACRVAGVEPEVVYECSVGQTLAALTEAGLGIAVLGDSVDLRGYDLSRRQVRGHHGEILAFDLHVAWSKDRRLPEPARRLAEDLAAHTTGPQAVDRAASRAVQRAS